MRVDIFSVVVGVMLSPCLVVPNQHGNMRVEIFSKVVGVVLSAVVFNRCSNMFVQISKPAAAWCYLPAAKQLLAYW